MTTLPPTAAHLPVAAMVKFSRALQFAAYKHRQQTRKDAAATPYINHPIDVTTVLIAEANITEVDVLCAALLHDTIEDTATTATELSAEFGPTVSAIVLEVSDDKTLPKAARKRLQIEHAAELSLAAKWVKLADKICNLRDIVQAPPAAWSAEQRLTYFDWAKDVVDALRGAHAELEAIFDQVYAARPKW